MLDAEQSYIQSALGYFVLALQAKYNAEIPVVYNTYQCYRKVSCCPTVRAIDDYAKDRGRPRRGLTFM